MNSGDHEAILKRLREQIATSQILVTQHAHSEMVDEAISLDEVLQALARGRILEDYPKHRRGACALIHGLTDQMRHLHVVCTTANPNLIIITVYEPKPPKWITPTRRRQSP